MTQATYTRTAHLALDDLTPFEGNAKRGNVEVILESLRRNGQYRSLVVREVQEGQLVVLAGNHTLRALAAHGPGDCGHEIMTGRKARPCGVCGNDPQWQPVARAEVVTCDDDTATRINVVDNRSSDLGTYDYEALGELLATLGEDVVGTGYSEQDVQDIADLLALPDDPVKGQAPGGDAGTTADGEVDEESPEAFQPVISLRVTHAVFDRWREALDAHPGDDDTDKLLGLLDEVEAARDAQDAA